MKPKYHFQPLPKTAAKERNFIAFDTETSSDGSFICGGYYGKIKKSHGNMVINEYCDTLQSFRETFLEIESAAKKAKRGFILVGFNSAYDLIYLGDIVKSDTRLDAGSRFIQAKTVNGTKIYDISNHVIGSLEEWIIRLKMQEKYGIFKRKNYLESEKGKREQVLDDAKATWILTKFVESDLINNFGISITPTKFGAALKIFQRNYFTGNWFRYEKEQWKNDLERLSYYGGRCEVFRRGLQNVQSYDVNSMYVAIMRDELIPNPTKTVYLKDYNQILRLIESDFLTVECRVKIPKLRVGLLPYRDKNNNNKLIFPYGEFNGVFNSIELKEALKHGLEITSIRRALWYPESENYFREYAEMTIQGRKEAKKRNDVASEQLFKYRGNGLYGKFGQQNKQGVRYIRLSQFQGDIEGHLIIPGAGDYWVEIPAEKTEDSWHTFPIIPATITAYARAKMLNALCNNSEILVYCDTDSLKVLGNPKGIQISEKPGDWGYEYTAEQVFFRPKRYANKRKGIPEKHVLIEANDEYEIYQFERPTKFKSAIRRHCNQNVWEKLEKTLSLIDDKREWLPDGTSWPLYVYEDANTYPTRIPPTNIHDSSVQGITKSIHFALP